MNKLLQILILLTAWVAFVAIHMSAVYSSLYWYIWWLDILMHAWGGFMIITSWYLVESLGVFKPLMSSWWFHSLLVLCVIMIGWELFEFRFGLISQYNYISDTIHDFLNGFGGGLVSFLLFRSRTIKT